VPRSPDQFPFTYRQRVRFGETDLQGVVYYANYLLYAEVGRVAYLRDLGIDYRRDLTEQGLDFTIAEARVRYLAPLTFDEEFDIRVRLGAIRHSSWTFEYLVSRSDGRAAAEMETIQVMLDRASGRPTRIPAQLLSILQRVGPA
jgi:acyl-CoA thioester hydrolase